MNFFVNPTPLATSVVTPNNLKTGGSTSVIEFRYVVDTSNFGTSNLSQVMPINGITKDIEVTRLVQPGEGFGYEIQGAGGGLGNALRASMTFVWYEETVN